ncbi:hypothetical protein B484DRAFT_408679 [Ochromonadaceae sp. CCMP2298]|nr:hypothetical protein B484DRAFT_408679 [Ochromonadaceae sp. CCMP2298]
MFLLGGSEGEDGLGDSASHSGGSDSGSSASSSAGCDPQGKKGGVHDSGGLVPVRAPFHAGSTATPAVTEATKGPVKPVVRPGTRRVYLGRRDYGASDGEVSGSVWWGRVPSHVAS